MTMSFLFKRRPINLLIPEEIPHRSEIIARRIDRSFAAKRPQKIDMGTNAKFNWGHSRLADMSRNSRFEYDCIV